MSNVTELEVVTEEAPQQSADEPPHRSAPNLRAVSRRAPIWADVPDSPVGLTGAGSSATG